MILGRAHRHNLFSYTHRYACWYSCGLQDHLLALEGGVPNLHWSRADTTEQHGLSISHMSFEEAYGYYTYGVVQTHTLYVAARSTDRAKDSTIHKYARFL